MIDYQINEFTPDEELSRLLNEIPFNTQERLTIIPQVIAEIDKRTKFEILDFNVGYEVDWNWIEYEVASMIGIELAKQIDEEIMKSLFEHIPKEEYISTNFFNKHFGINPEKNQPKYSHYDKVMNSVININIG